MKFMYAILRFSLFASVKYIDLVDLIFKSVIDKKQD
jgi:hypothetical protein